MRPLAVGGIVGAFVCLAGAAWLGDPLWRWSLTGVMACLSVAVCAGSGMLAARLLPPTWRGAVAGVWVGLASALTRQVLMAMIRARAAGAPPQIRPLSLFAAVFTLVGGAFALLWGVAALRRLMAEPGGEQRGRGWPGLLLGGSAVALGLYGLSPVGQALGVRVNHWTFIGLVVLALVAYGIEELVGRALDRGPRAAGRGARGRGARP